MLYAHLQHHNDTIRRRKTSLNKYVPLTLLQGFERLCRVLLWEGAGDRTETVIFWPQTYGHQRCVFLVLLMFHRRSRGPLCWVMAFFTESYQHLLRTSTHQGPKAPSAWCGFPYHVSSPTGTQLNLTSVLTELYNSSTPTRSPTWSLKSHV